MGRRVWAAVLGGLALVVLMAVVGAQAPTVTLSGKVTSDSLPLAGASVSAEDTLGRTKPVQDHG